MYKHIALFTTVCLITATEANFRAPSLGRELARNEKKRVEKIKAKYEDNTDVETKYFAAKIDHFDNHGADEATYQMRYLVNKSHFDASTGPILFYAGNEGDIWSFYDNTGFMTENLAETYGALVVFGEHRFFGESMPYGPDSLKDSANYPVLTPE